MNKKFFAFTVSMLALAMVITSCGKDDSETAADSAPLALPFVQPTAAQWTAYFVVEGETATVQRNYWSDSGFRVESYMRNDGSESLATTVIITDGIWRQKDAGDSDWQRVIVDPGRRTGLPELLVSVADVVANGEEIDSIESGPITASGREKHLVEDGVTVQAWTSPDSQLRRVVFFGEGHLKEIPWIHYGDLSDSLFVE